MLRFSCEYSQGVHQTLGLQLAAASHAIPAAVTRRRGLNRGEEAPRIPLSQGPDEAGSLGVADQDPPAGLCLTALP